MEDNSKEAEKMYELGKRAYCNGDYATARNHFMRSAGLENSEAMTAIGIMYCDGLGVEKNLEKAMYWLDKAIELNNTKAMGNKACIYRDGELLEQDGLKAIEWFNRAFELGNISGMYSIGWMYRLGKGVKKDPLEAMKCYTKAAELGHVDSMFSIGCMYKDKEIEFEEYVDQNEEAIRWFKKAAHLGYTKAIRTIGEVYESENLLSEAIKWYIKAADCNDDMALERIADIYKYYKVLEAKFEEIFFASEESTEKFEEASEYISALSEKLYETYEMYCQKNDMEQADKYRDKYVQLDKELCIYDLYKESKDWIKRAYEINELDVISYTKKTEQGEEERVQLLGYEAALYFYQRAAELGNGCAMYNIACMYDFGDGIEKNKEEAEKWYKRAFRCCKKVADVFDDWEDINDVAEMYRDGKGVEQNGKEAIKYFTKIHDWRSIAGMYQKGIGVEENSEEAAKYLNKTKLE